MRRALIILSIVLHKQLVNAIGLKLPGSEWSITGLGMGTTTASATMAENSQIPRRGYILLTEQMEPNLEGGLKVGNGPGPNQWPSR